VLSQIIQEYPRYLPAYNEASSIYVRSGRLKDAETVLRSGLRQEPRDPILNNNLGMVWFLRHDYDQALEHFTNATEVAPDNPTYRANRRRRWGCSGGTARRWRRIVAWSRVLQRRTT
jgi:Flp pilus assembly protein TadD